MISDRVRTEIEQLRVADIAPGQAALAISLAETYDDTEAPTARAVVARELAAAMKTLRALAPVGEEGDVVDEFKRKRDERRARGA
ncbi:hypothetical protein ABZ508_02625 [Streptomyces lavendulocolor]|uniref:Terminase small subunit n=1 Tax=Streptomyces lavendulocolor TaxID=67316 RepID=A0ABV2W1U6_9ACTN